MSSRNPLHDPEVVRSLPSVEAVELFISEGFDCVAGFPLPNKMLPVGTKGQGMVLMAPDAWEEYRQLCAFQRSMSPLTAAA